MKTFSFWIERYHNGQYERKRISTKGYNVEIAQLDVSRAHSEWMVTPTWDSAAA